MTTLLKPSLRLTHERPIMLVVDDYAPLRNAIVRMFKRDYHEVAEAPSGNAAIAWLTDWATKENENSDERAIYSHPVVVLSDVDMPDGSGFDLAAWCLKHGVPIVLWSGASSDAGALAQRTATAIGLPGEITLKGNFIDVKTAILRAEEAAGISR